MNISIYVKPEDLTYFLQVISILKTLTVDNTYTFNTTDIKWQETFNSEYIHCSLEMSLYLIWKTSWLRNSKN